MLSTARVTALMWSIDHDAIQVGESLATWAWEGNGLRIGSSASFRLSTCTPGGVCRDGAPSSRHRCTVRARRTRIATAEASAPCRSPLHLVPVTGCLALNLV